MRRIRATLYVSVLALSLVILSGCAVPAIVSGGGTMPSALVSGKATFTFSGNSCSDITGAVNYVDKAADKAYDVKFNGTATAAGLCECAEGEELPPCAEKCDLGWYLIDFDYTSTNPRMRGTGSGYACLQQGTGTGKNKGHQGTIYIEDGPFSGYSNEGLIQGNVTISSCPE